MERPAAEFTVICIDNSKLTDWSDRRYDAQIKGAKLYCETVFECNPDNIVSIFTMSSPSHGELVTPTSDLKEILSALKDVYCEPFGETEFQSVLYQACKIFSRGPKNMKRRLLMFVGSLIHLQLPMAISHGMELKSKGVALDVFNLYDSDIDPSLYKEATMLYSKYHYAKKELEALVINANDNGSSHISDVSDKSGVRKILSDSILKEHFDYLDHKAANEKQEVGPSRRIKKNIKSTLKKCLKNRNKPTLKECQKDRNKPTLKECQKDRYKPTLKKCQKNSRNSPTENIQLGKPTLKQCQKDKNSPTDDECVEPPRKKNKRNVKG